MTIRRIFKSSKRQLYVIADSSNDIIVKFNDLKTAAIVLRYMQGGNMSDDERIAALAALELEKSDT